MRIRHLQNEFHIFYTQINKFSLAEIIKLRNIIDLSKLSKRKKIVFHHIIAECPDMGKPLVDC